MPSPFIHYLHSGLHKWSCVFTDSGRTDDWAVSATIWNLYSREGGQAFHLMKSFFPNGSSQPVTSLAALGKWHLGLTEEYHAMNRGFDEFYGFMGRGAHPYFDHSDMSHPIYRGLTPIKEEGYLTTRITEEAVDFIGRHKDEPFFLYVAYNAVHAPPEAPEEDIKQVTGDETRDTLMAMIKHLDMGVGEIVNSLRSIPCLTTHYSFF